MTPNLVVQLISLFPSRSPDVIRRSVTHPTTQAGDTPDLPFADMPIRRAAVVVCKLPNRGNDYLAPKTATATRVNADSWTLGNGWVSNAFSRVFVTPLG